MAPASSTETKHITLHNFLKQQHLLQQRLKPAAAAVLWSWPVPTRGAPAHDEDADGGASWPPRSYTCAFCRREFRSAQALGGHMNVHRRDRAKMRGHYAASAAASALAPPSSPSPADEPAVAAAEYALIYPVLNSNNGARGVFIPGAGGNVLLSAAPMELGRRCELSDDENESSIDLELRLGWP
ncbi:probable transcriptional regulator RABBIT EARS [Brachypodium distachyon]|uniref:C2H2-type domain-containing protein n=1 Tax=Brachypodium distachyon TaxID=15368 RepID=I1J156_BRADI|nr:probable transcriptional regulator RABBIT EARS [Brachypodium distachyon]KQJ84296.1 hypothetical protein BRADI_5g19930v3 [Brachypodium distachyon]|eukprot:XP_010227240.1 probable transcriptional regulator RABBIT EARS [Brachypodium distachyon]